MKKVLAIVVVGGIAGYFVVQAIPWIVGAGMVYGGYKGYQYLKDKGGN